jgi:2-amino-4-hydroxy-6-hydroxymethyldihydropteridine diphosphokinase
MTVAFVGLGANIGDPCRQLEAAAEQLKRMPDTNFVRLSGFYKSAPVGYVNQPDFLNAVACLETALSAERLLENLQKIEQGQGRERSFANAPRRLDLDLLLYGDQVLDTPALTLPHPRMHERAFVLLPLLELDPEISIPGRGKAGVLLSACGSQNIERID